ncbi:Organic cation transporter protein [Nymphon striatum]|nr:Organic cation transporter protein [Nymphon striatum]
MEFSKPKRNFIETICLTADTPLSVLEDRRLRGSSFTSEFFLSIIHACQPWKLPNSQFHGRFQISKFWLSSYLCILIFNLFFMFTNITFFFLMYLHVFSYILPVMSTCSPLGFERGNEWPDLFLHMGTQHPVGMIKNKTMVGSFTNLISNWNSRRMENYLNDMNLISLFCGTQNVAMPFYAPSIDHWCSKPDHLEELSTELWKNYSLPSEETEGGKHTYSSCKQYDIDYKNISVAEYVSFMNNFKSGNRTVSEKSCSSWAYDKSFWKETIVSDWNLVCDKSVLVTVISSVYMAGMMFGLLIIPQFSDRFGRKPVILIVLLVCFVSTLGLTFSPNIIIFSVLRFVIAATDIPGTSMIFIMGQECLSERNRALWGNLSNVSFPIGTLFLTMFSYLTTNWRITQVIAIVPLIIMFILHLKMDNYLNELVKKTGWWQILMLMSMTLIAFFCGIQNVAMPFYAPLVDHWCAKPNHLKELPTKQWKNYSLPSEETKGGKITYSSCKQFDIDYTNISVADYVSFMDNFKSGNRTVSEKSCSSWTYDKSIWKETIVSDWNLVCDKSVLVSVTSSVYMAGMACGVFIIPQFSDRFGRKPVILIVLLVCFVSTLSLTFSPNIIIFTVLRFLIAATDIPGASMIYVIGQECLSERNRALWGNITSVGFSVGTLVLTMFSYLTKSWRITPLISIVPLIMMFILHLKIPESLRWQLSMGKYDKALKTMKVCSGMNRYTLPSEDILQQEIENIKVNINNLLMFSNHINYCYQFNPQRFFYKKEKTIEEKDKRNKKTKVTLLDLFKTPEVRIRTLITYLLWFTVSFCYYAFTLNLQDIAGNLFLNMTIAAILESFGGISSSLLMLKFGRRLPTSFLMFFSGVTILLSIAVPTRLTWLKVGLSLIGRTSISMVFAIMFLHTTEYMPTVARSIGLGSSSLFARFGAIISPYVHELKEVSSESVVFAIYGVMCILCGLSTLRLPETRNQPLQEFIEDAENYDYKSKRTYEYPPHVISVHVLSEGRRSFPSGLICVRNPKEKHDTKQREVGVLNIKSNLGESDPTYVEEVYES